MISTIVKRDGRTVPFDSQKIEQAIAKAFAASGEVFVLSSNRITSKGKGSVLKNSLTL